ncbi:MAG TPA: tetratricopeptide repeat protein [Polyangiaceae bacterium]|nr:tetratricopeptide repeat protein [Polyangiaceae bacterium]
MRRASALRSIAAAWTIAACAGPSSDLTPKEAAAERAYAAGRYLEAAGHFAEAATASAKPRDREEARYRQGMSLERAGRNDDARAVLETLLREHPLGERVPRARYDIALVDLEQGRTDDGQRELDALIRSYPASGPAPTALHRHVEWLLDGTGGEPAARAYLQALAPVIATTSLAEYVDYEHARSHEREGDLDGARTEYVALAARYPYPRGVFWDDALFRAGDIDVTLGDPNAAIAMFERLLAEREPSFMQGSYERGRYADAAFRLAELYRDALHDPARARQAFERFSTAYPTSRLRDDASWNAARLAASAGDGDGACRLLRSLVAASPESRYVACAPVICPAIRPPQNTSDTRNTGQCHEYLLRTGP